jgi:hypothetical protein
MITAILLWVFMQVVLVFGITSVPPSWKLLRAGLLGLSCASAYHISVSPVALAENSAIDGLFKGSMYPALLRGFDLLFLRHRTMPSGKFMDNEKMGIWPEWTSPLHLVLNGRDLGTPYVIKRVPPFSNGDKTYVPSRGAFLLRQTITFSICYLVLELFSLLREPVNPAMFSETNEHLFTRLHEISHQEAVLRTMATVGFYLNAALFLSAIYDFFSILFVGLGLTSPRYWPPAFSSFLEAYTIRQFWGQARPTNFKIM